MVAVMVVCWECLRLAGRERQDLVVSKARGPWVGVELSMGWLVAAGVGHSVHMRSGSH